VMQRPLTVKHAVTDIRNLHGVRLLCPYSSLSHLVVMQANKAAVEDLQHQLQEKQSLLEDTQVMIDEKQSLLEGKQVEIEEKQSLLEDKQGMIDSLGSRLTASIDQVSTVRQVLASAHKAHDADTQVCSIQACL